MRIVLNVMIVLVAMACSQPKHDGYLIKGNIKGIEEGKIVLSYYDRTNSKLVSIDSAQIENGKFEMLGKVEYPQNLVLAMLHSHFGSKIPKSQLKEI